MKCLGLDIGSSSIKGAVLDLDRNTIDSVTLRPFPSPISGLKSGWVEISPIEIQNEALCVLDQLLDVEPDPIALFCSGQMGGLVLVDSAGAALTNYISWRDQRALAAHTSQSSYVDTIRARWSHSLLADLGNELQAGSTSTLLFWLAENGQLPEDAMPATVADFVLGRLCQTVPQMDPTHAIGLLNLNVVDWHRAAFDLLGLGRVRWPRLAKPSEPIGQMTLRGRRIHCHASMGDQQCALRGVGLTREELSLNISTGSQVSQRTVRFQPGPYQSRQYFDGDFLNTITHLPAGRSLNVLCDLLTELASAQGLTVSNPWEYIANSSAKSDGGGLGVDLAFFSGPLGDRGSVTGITTENLTVGNLFHAAFVTMADNYARCIQRLCPDHSKYRLALSGGLPRSVPVLRELIQARFGGPLRESAATEETLLGLLDIAKSVY